MSTLIVLVAAALLASALVMADRRPAPRKIAVRARRLR
jgi:hypothetical protein